MSLKLSSLTRLTIIKWWNENVLRVVLKNLGIEKGPSLSKDDKERIKGELAKHTLFTTEDSDYQIIETLISKGVNVSEKIPKLLRAKGVAECNRMTEYIRLNKPTVAEGEGENMERNVQEELDVAQVETKQPNNCVPNFEIPNFEMKPIETTVVSTQDIPSIETKKMTVHIKQGRFVALKAFFAECAKSSESNKNEKPTGMKFDFDTALKMMEETKNDGQEALGDIFHDM